MKCVGFLNPLDYKIYKKVYTQIGTWTEIIFEVKDGEKVETESNSEGESILEFPNGDRFVDWYEEDAEVYVDNEKKQIKCDVLLDLSEEDIQEILKKNGYEGYTIIEG